MVDGNKGSAKRILILDVYVIVTTTPSNIVPKHLRQSLSCTYTQHPMLLHFKYAARDSRRDGPVRTDVHGDAGHRTPWSRGGFQKSRRHLPSHGDREFDGMDNVEDGTDVIVRTLLY
jgi:hypothetical protein